MLGQAYVPRRLRILQSIIDATRYCIAQDALSIVCTSYDAIPFRSSLGLIEYARD